MVEIKIFVTTTRGNDVVVTINPRRKLNEGKTKPYVSKKRKKKEKEMISLHRDKFIWREKQT